MKRTLILLFALSSIVWCQAQNTISGVLQSTDNLPVDYANIVLLAQADSTFLTGAVSGEDGSFSLIIPAQTGASCLMRVSSVGYKTAYKSVQPGNLGILRMESDTQMLGEVVIKANLPVTRLKGDAMATNIDGTVLAKAGTAQDVLNYIPGVASQKGSLQVLGRGAPVVYVNGRLMRNASELEQLSSEDILSVEVINNPGARYDASVKAVIRIQTKKAVGDGLGFSNRMYANYNKEWDLLNQFNVNYRKGGLDIFGMLYLYHGYSWERMEIVQNTYLKQYWKQILREEGNGTHKDITIDLGMNYLFNPNHSVGFKYQYMRYPDNHNENLFNAEISQNGLPFEQTRSVSQIEGQSMAHSVNLYYNGIAKSWNIDLNTDLLWIDFGENSNVQERMNPQEGIVTERLVETYSNTRNKLYASKLVFSHPLLGGNFAFGGELSHTNRNTDYRNPQGILANDVSEIKENNATAFTEFSREWGAIQLEAGLRYEHTAFDYYQEGVRQDGQSKKYDEFFPSVSIGMSFGKANMQLSYTQDISRPSFHSLRSNVYYANHYTYETGNPFLLPTITHNFNLMGTYKWWQLYASYQRQKDDVMFTMEAYSQNDPNIALIKPINIKSYDMAYVRLTATPTIGLWSPRFTLSARKQWFDMDTHEGKISLNRPQFSFRWQNSLKLPAGFLLGMDGNWYGKSDNGNSRTVRASWSIDASLHKGFFNDRLTFQLKGHDIFLTQRYSRMDYFSEIYSMGKTVHPNTRSVSLTVRYRFNQAKDKYKGAGAGEEQKNRL